MIREVDYALEQLLKRRLGEKIRVSFAPPAQVEAERARGAAEGAVLDLHLLDVREEGGMRSSGVARVHADDGTIVRQAPPRWYRLAYWLTAWARDAGTEHDALGAALAALAAHDALPVDLLTGALTGSERPVRLEVAMPPAGEAFAAGVWSSLRLPMKGAVHVSVLAPVAGEVDSGANKIVYDRQLRVTGPPPPRQPDMTPPPGVPEVLMPGAGPKPPMPGAPVGVALPPAAPGAVRPPDASPGVRPPMGAPGGVPPVGGRRPTAVAGGAPTPRARSGTEPQPPSAGAAPAFGAPLAPAATPPSGAPRPPAATPPEGAPPGAPRPMPAPGALSVRPAASGPESAEGRPPRDDATAKPKTVEELIYGPDPATSPRVVE